ncbi:MAG: hypothetical protein QOJ64_4221 [Acidobacteriota bacterium]|nr:hypothetical protein [Acidobacteriota bacterium]
MSEAYGPGENCMLNGSEDGFLEVVFFFVLVQVFFFDDI